jgi:hypothetical protein
VLDVCERLNLRVAPNGSSHLSPLGDPRTNGDGDQTRSNRAKPRKR